MASKDHGLTPIELSSFCSEIALMLGAGMPLYAGMEALEKTYEDDAHAALYRGVSETLTQTGSLRDALAYAEKYLVIQMNSTDDNPCLLLDEKRIISNSNFETTTLATAVEMLSIVLSHVSRMSCYRMLRLANPELTKLPRFLSHDGGESHCFGTIQKCFGSLDTEIRHLSNPCSVDYLSLSGSIEDHSNNTPLVVQHLRQIVKDLQYIYGMELIHACQAIELRKQRDGFALGKGTAAAYEAFRRVIPLYTNDRPLAPDVKKAYEFVKSAAILKSVKEVL